MTRRKFTFTIAVECDSDQDASAVADAIDWLIWAALNTSDITVEMHNPDMRNVDIMELDGQLQFMLEHPGAYENPRDMLREVYKHMDLPIPDFCKDE